MKNKYTFITSVIIVLLFIGTIVGIFVFYKLPKVTPEFDYLKNYKDNEYMPAYISEEKMVNLYYKDYLTYVRTDIQKAYDLLNDEYKKKRFPTIDSFKSFIIPFENFTPESYAVELKDEKKVFYIKLTDGNEIIFSTTGVMIYEVYFDEITVNIE